MEEEQASEGGPINASDVRCCKIFLKNRANYVHIAWMFVEGNSKVPMDSFN